ncbi:hypothetical protein Lal_00032367 [Lupinus albus]|nr:hypothetical protein Lal_00032367 [Lupinus albus]
MKFVNYISQWRNAAKEALDHTAITLKFLCWLHVTNNYLCSPTHVYGPSMLPTLNLAGDVILAEHLSPRIGKVGHGDLVVVRSPFNPNRNLTKRIVGMEGDTVTFFDPLRGDATQTVVILECCDDKIGLPMNELEVPKGHVWIQGDNIYASHDSRHFGPIPYGLIQGKVFFRGLMNFELLCIWKFYGADSLISLWSVSSKMLELFFHGGASVIAIEVAVCKGLMTLVPFGSKQKI